jgi:hypothetical protein
VADPGPTRDRRLQVALGTYAVVVFAVLWVGFAVGLVSSGQAFADAWGWLNGLEPVARIAAWILFLPIAIGLWAWNADLPAPAFAAVYAGLVAWTLVAVVGLVRAVRRR